MEASREGHYEIAKLLLQNGADANLLDASGYTSLEIASNNGYYGIVKLLNKGNELEEWRPWNHHKYPLMYLKTMRTLVLLAKIV